MPTRAQTGPHSSRLSDDSRYEIRGGDGCPPSKVHPGQNSVLNCSFRASFHAARFDSERNLDGEESNGTAFFAKIREISPGELLPYSLNRNNSDDFTVKSLTRPRLEF